MPTIEWTIDIKDSLGKTCFYEPDAIIEFSHEIDDGEIVISVDGFTNMHGAYFSCDADSSMGRIIWLSVAGFLESDETFLEQAFDIIASEHYFTGFGPNNPETMTFRRV